MKKLARLAKNLCWCGVCGFEVHWASSPGSCFQAVKRTSSPSKKDSVITGSAIAAGQRLQGAGLLRGSGPWPGAKRSAPQQQGWRWFAKTAQGLTGCLGASRCAAELQQPRCVVTAVEWRGHPCHPCRSPVQGPDGWLLRAVAAASAAGSGCRRWQPAPGGSAP